MNGVMEKMAPAPILSELDRPGNRPIIECHDLWKVFGNLPAEALAGLRERRLSRAEVMERYGCVVGLAGISVRVEQGDICCVMGLSGSGKSTLVRHINGLILPTSGRVTVDGVAYGPIRAALDGQKGENAWLTVSLREGKNREIRRVMEHLGYITNRLIRVAYGPFQLGELERGAAAEVTGRVLRDQLGAAAEVAVGRTAGATAAEPARPRAAERH